MKTFALLSILICLQHTKTFAQTDSVRAMQKAADDTVRADTTGRNNISPARNARQKLSDVLRANAFINFTLQPELAINQKKKVSGKEFLFYLLCGTLLLFGLFKLFYTGYFRNVLQVFFNTSLRQNHLTDLLLQAKLPSLIFNIFFVINGGLYAWLLLARYNPAAAEHYASDHILVFCITAIGLIYLAKYCILKCVGWLTGMRPVLNTYIFITFLINKITGMVLMPFIIFLAFAGPAFFDITVTLSLLILSVLFIMRYLRSFSILQHQIDLTRMHLLLYIFSVEVLPLIVMYKISLRFL